MMPRANAKHFRAIPKTVVELKDDPFRSLAGELRRVGGFAKDTTPFSEFLLGGFPTPPVIAQERGGQFRQGHRKGAGPWPKSKDAVYLPGWCGPTSDD